MSCVEEFNGTRVSTASSSDIPRRLPMSTAIVRNEQWAAVPYQKRLLPRDQVDGAEVPEVDT
jgi:hypothetical protein